MLGPMEEEPPDHDQAFDAACAAVEAAAQGTGELADARAAFMEISEFRPKGMEPEFQQPGPEKAYGDAANSLKMAIDALEGNQTELAMSYIRVAKIKLEKAREA